MTARTLLLGCRPPRDFFRKERAHHKSADHSSDRQCARVPRSTPIGACHKKFVPAGFASERANDRLEDLLGRALVW